MKKDDPNILQVPPSSSAIGPTGSMNILNPMSPMNPFGPGSLSLLSTCRVFIYAILCDGASRRLLMTVYAQTKCRQRVFYCRLTVA